MAESPSPTGLPERGVAGRRACGGPAPLGPSPSRLAPASQFLKVGWPGAAMLPLWIGLISTGAVLLAYDVKPYTWSTLTVLYLVNPETSDAAPAAVVASVQAGASTWHDQAGVAFRWSYAGTTSQTTVTLDGRNIVVFRPEANGSTIATTYWWVDSTGHFLDADVKFWDSGFFFLPDDAPCSGGFYIRDIAAHEFGHALGLNHSAVPGATMYASTSSCSTKFRTLDPDDIAGVRTLYPPQTLPPPAPSGVAVTR